MDTGDLGMINFKDTLTFGSCKDTVVLLGGKNVEPVLYENKLSDLLLPGQANGNRTRPKKSRRHHRS